MLSSATRESASFLGGGVGWGGGERGSLVILARVLARVS